jgi:hypothetical protein
MKFDTELEAFPMEFNIESEKFLGTLPILRIHRLKEFIISFSVF